MKSNIHDYFLCFAASVFVMCALFLAGGAATWFIVGFSVILLGFVWTRFIESRAQEFHAYMTLGFSLRDLQKMMFIEGGIVFAGAAAFWLLPLFYLWLAQMLGRPMFYVNFILFSFGASAVVFACQQLIISLAVRRIFSRAKPRGSALAALARLFPWVGVRRVLLLSLFKLHIAPVFIAVLIAFSVFFITSGINSGGYDHILDYLPHHFTVESRAGINDVSHDDLRQIIHESGGEISHIRSLPYLDAAVFRYFGSPLGMFRHIEQQSFLVSASNFGRFTGQDFSVPPGHLLIATNNRYAYETGVYFETALRTAPDAPELRFTIPQTTMIFLPFTNSYESYAHIINDNDWHVLSGDKNTLTMFNLSHGDHSLVMARLLEELAALNNIPASTWANPVDFAYDRRDDMLQLRPISQAQKLNIFLETNRFLLRVSVLTGLFFLTSTAMMLYCEYKTHAKKTREDIARLKTAGLTTAEYRRYLISRTILMFLPIVLGVVVGILL